MSLSSAEAEALFGRMLDGGMNEDEVRDALIAMADRGETAAEVAGAAQAMRARMIRIAAPPTAIDVCGTGGDGSHSLNVSTAVAIVVAACGVPVAKHGNRAASSKAGGADTLEALGLDLDRASASAEAMLADLGICFLFAQKHHPALARIAPIRKALGRRTIFNLIGPLCNPAGVKRQLVGVPTPATIPLYAKAMRLLGTDRAMIVSGDEGLDEMSVSGPNTLCTIGDFPGNADGEMGKAASFEMNLGVYPPNALKGGDAAYNAVALRRLLAGERDTLQDRAFRDAVILNASCALMVAGKGNWFSNVEEVGEIIDKGLPKALLDCWVTYR